MGRMKMPRTILRSKKDHVVSADGSSSSENDQKDEFLGKLAKYIPAEITAAYLFLIGIINGVTDAPPIILWISLAVLMGAAPLYLYVVALREKATPDKAQIAISVPAFFIWAFAIGGPFTVFTWYNPAYGAVLVGLATVLIPLVDFLITRNK
jgi:hypothetical protein